MTPDSRSDLPTSLELLPGGARELGFSGAPLELSPDVLEALATDSPLLPAREPLGVRLAAYFGRHQFLLLILSFLALWAIVALPVWTPAGDLAPGQVAPRDLVAPQNAFIPDRAETEKRRAAASALVTPAYNPNPSALSRALDELPTVFKRAQLAARGVVFPQIAVSNSNNAPLPNVPVNVPNLAPVPPARQFAARSEFIAPENLVRAMKNLPSPRWELLEIGAGEAIRAAYVSGRVRSDVQSDVAALRPFLARGVSKFALQTPLSASEIQIATLLALRAARFPNVVVNRKATDEARREARNAVLPVFERIEANAPLVREGELLTRSQWQQLQELGLVAPQWKPAEIFAYGALCLMLVGGASAYLARARRDLLDRPAALWLVAVIPVAFLLIFRLILRVPHADFLMVPLAATSAMIVTVLLDARIGLPAGFVVAALCALMARADSGLFLAATLSAWIGSLSVAHLSSRMALVRSVLIMALTNAILAGALGFLRESALDEIASTVAWSALAGMASVAVMAAGAIFLERPFGITSHLRLLELLAPDETVLRRMQSEAAGTYTHSLMVATLGENAAKAIGADSLLCRVGGLYHDIGKLRRPHCFIENQSGDNIHDRLSPALSALLIRAHVKDGLDLGRAIRLPQPVLEIIASHHGIGLIAWFWNKSKQNAPQNVVLDEKNYRYHGPRPRTREAAIILLADSVEASARVLGDNSPESIAAHVQNMVETRLREGELDDCDLSLREIGLIREAFENTLRGALHGRINYPDATTLPGELARNSDEWVRQTLGRENGDETRGRRQKPAPRVKIEKNAHDADQSPNAAPESETEALNARGRRARRRFRSANNSAPPATHDRPSNGQTATDSQINADAQNLDSLESGSENRPANSS